MIDLKVLAFPAVTAALAGFFLTPLGAEKTNTTSYAALEGSALAQEQPRTAAQPESAQPAKSAIAAAAKPAPVPKDGKAERARQPPRASARAHAPKRPAASSASEATPTAVAKSTEVAKPSAAPGSSGPDEVPQYVIQDLIDGFENDPAKFLLGTTAKSSGIALTLVGIERRGAMFVLKVDVANESPSDFFVKGFVVQAGTTVLSSRTDFRILVEPQRERSGYVFFPAPRAGAVVQITLKEDGGMRRAIRVPVSYPF